MSPAESGDEGHGPAREGAERGRLQGPSVARRFLTDAHAHLSLVADRLGAAAIVGLDKAWSPGTRASGEGATSPFVVDVGVDAEDFEERKRRFGGFPWVRLTAGAWPGKVAVEGRERALAALRAAAADSACVAIGECGLDYFHDEAPRADQLALFLGQADIAREHGLPLVVHSRDAFEDTAGALREASPSTPVVIHCFGYDRDAARIFLDLGCFVSFAGNVTYRKAAALRDALAYVPEDRLLLETDAPYLAPEGLRGKPCSPLDVGLTYDFAAALRDTGVERLEALIRGNAGAVFKRRRGGGRVGEPKRPRGGTRDGRVDG
ncbi:MAG: TatD family hydrolase [Spirochaetia bacterium]|nr:TatD family hydrolase [Spirochaetia bacterium]